jgi:uncharacterized protein (TIGR02413 family)
VTSCGLFVPFYEQFGYVVHTLKMLLEVIGMTLNILFFSITIKKREINLEEAAQQEMVEKLYEANKDRQISMYHLY